MADEMGKVAFDAYRTSRSFDTPMPAWGDLDETMRASWCKVADAVLKAAKSGSLTAWRDSFLSEQQQAELTQREFQANHSPGAPSHDVLLGKIAALLDDTFGTPRKDDKK